ncbi:hypothetical protein F5Y14DRAFT_449173 [Nemania sp. NC0429]|nr:hypothetical protein F5Y14DRAFT_449173 [Nemania sp. NC0429]
MKPNDTIAVIVTVLILAIFVGFYVSTRRFRQDDDDDDDNNSGSDGSSLSYFPPSSSSSSPSGRSGVDVYVSDAAPHPPPQVYMRRGEPQGTVPVDARPDGSGDWIAPAVVDVQHPGDS